MMDENDRYGGYYGEAGTRNPEEPASAAYLPAEPDYDMKQAVAEDAAANDDDEYDTYYTPKLAASARALGSEMSGLTNDGMGVMTPDYSDVNQASVWGPTRLDPFPPGIAKQDILALLAYNWKDEEVDYYNVLASQDISADELNKTHIFAAMNRINDWITRHG